MRVASFLPVIPALLLGACLGGEWARVQAQDSPAAYQRFLREHPGAAQVETARERLAVLELESDPSYEALERFHQAFPDSDARPALEARVEEAEFARARRLGTPSAYERFLALFPDGDEALRARGNADYLRARGYVGRPDGLADFAERFPSSDYAVEARRSLALPGLEQRTRLRTVGLRVVLDAATPGAPRLAAAFREHAERAYAEAGLALVTLPAEADAPPPTVDAVLEIRHGEDTVATELVSGRVVPAGIRARTTVSLTRTGEQTPVWSESFGLRVADGEGRRGESILFGVRGPVFWKSFFVPVARWQSDAARRGVTPLPEGAVDLDVREGRVCALFSDGRFRVLDLAEPAHPRLVSEYRRPRDLSRFDGVWHLGDRVAVFGEGGLEIVALGEEPRRLVAFGRDRVGSVRAVTASTDALLVAGSHGLLRIAAGGTGTLEVLVERALRDIVRLDEQRLAFLDDAALTVATPEALRAGRVEARVRLGLGFRPYRLRTDGRIAVVIGELGVLVFDLVRPGAPRTLARLGRRDAGAVRDAAVIDGTLFLVGERGLQIFDTRTGRIVESVDVEPRSRIAAWGRHLVTLDAAALQVVDATPWLWGAAPAAPAR